MTKLWWDALPERKEGPSDDTRLRVWEDPEGPEVVDHRGHFLTIDEMADVTGNEWPVGWDENPMMERELEEGFVARILPLVHTPEQLERAQTAIVAIAPDMVGLVQARELSLEEEINWMRERIQRHHINRVVKEDLPLIEKWGAIELYRPELEAKIAH